MVRATPLARTLLSALIAASVLIAGTLSAPAARTAAETAFGGGPRWTLIRGSVLPELRSARRRAALPTSRRLGISLTLRVTDQAALDRFLTDVYNPSSPSYRKFLTPEEFAARFAPDTSSRDQVVIWLKSQGLRVTGTSRNGLQIQAEATVERLQTAFNTPLYAFTRQNRSFFANAQPVRLPASLASRVVAVSGLSDGIQQSPAQYRQLQTGPTRGYIPSDLQSIYNLTPLLARGINGAGQTVAIATFGDYSETDLATYDQRFNIPTNVTRLNVSDGRSSGGGLGARRGQDETESDTEIIQAAAPQAQILVYEAPNSEQGTINLYNQLVSDDRAPVITTSWGGAETSYPASFMTAIHQSVQEAAAQGQALIAASGDSGAYDAAGSGPGTDDQLAVDYPASDPWVTGVGGTTLQTIGAQYQRELAWYDNSDARNPIGSGGGLSLLYSRPDYQTGPGVDNQYSNGMRQVPDVASDADPSTGYANYTVNSRNIPEWNVAGGTSLAAPLWAGFAALINQAVGHPVGFLNPALYRLGQQSSTFSPAPFHDVVDGNNLYYPATPGWDFATGWGSFDGAVLVADLQGVPLPTAAPTSTPRPTVPPTATPRPTSTPVPPTVSITQVVLLHSVKGKLQKTGTLKLGEKGTLIIVYQSHGAGSLGTFGSVSLRQNGRLIKTMNLNRTQYQGKSALSTTVRFTSKQRVGTLLAHVTVTIGLVSSARNYSFKLVVK